MVGIVILASCKHHFIIVHENLMQRPSNSISIILHLDFVINLNFACLHTGNWRSLNDKKIFTNKIILTAGVLQLFMVDIRTNLSSM